MTTTLNAGSILQGGRYKVLDILGQGGFGITYLGLQSGLERKVAIKEFYMKEYCARDAENSRVTIGTEGARQMVERFREKFLNEARKLAQLNHANIVRVIDVFQENETAYYVMEYAEGGSLSQKVKSVGPLPIDVVVRYGQEVGSALDYIHEQRMNHLDIKPGNIMLNGKGETVIIDFGMSKHYDAQTGNETSTTPVGISDGYAPMEQYRPGGVGEFSPQTDIYALGATLYFLLTGTKPPSASDVNEDGLPLGLLKTRGVGESLISVITKAMEPRKKQRYATAKEFLLALESCDTTPTADDSEATVLRVNNAEELARKAREEADRRAREELRVKSEELRAREEAERKAREEAERKTREEAERKAREEAERKARKEAERRNAAQNAGNTPHTVASPISVPPPPPTPFPTQPKSGKGKLWIAIGAVAVVGLAALFGLGMMAGSDEPDPADTLTTENVAREMVENIQIQLDHGHATKRTFTYTGEVNPDGIPEGQGTAVYPETKGCSSCVFKGTFANGLPSEGDLEFASGSKYHGTFDSEGGYAEGDLTDKEGYTFKGTYKDGAPYNGTWYNPTGKEDGKIVDGIDQ